MGSGSATRGRSTASRARLPLAGAEQVGRSAQHPDRNAQFEYINAKAQECIERGFPVVSVDTKKKELVGNFKNAGREWQPTGEPQLVDVHDFPTDAVGKAIPYGVYDVAANDGFVSVGVDHDTPVFAVTSIEAWWNQVGSKRYPDARELFINADAGGSNGYRSNVWKYELQRLADKFDLSIHVSHFPLGTSKWNKVEHRLFSHISINWRGRPLRTYETIINLISNTTNRGGLLVRARLDRRRYYRLGPAGARGVGQGRGVCGPVCPVGATGVVRTSVARRSAIRTRIARGIPELAAIVDPRDRRFVRPILS